MICQICKGLSSPRRCDQVTHSRAPLDSTVNYPITRSPNKHHETGKIENLSRSYLCLEHIPLELDDDDLDHLKMEHLFLDCSSLVKTCKLLPHTHMGEPLLWEGLHISMNLLVEDLQTAPPYSYARASSLGMSSYIHDHPEDGKLQAYDLF